MVNTFYPAAPNVVLDQVTKPLETSLSNIEGVLRTRSVSSDNFSGIQVDLKDGVRPDIMKAEIEKALSTVHLPSTAGKPDVNTVSTTTDPVYELALSGDGLSQKELDDLANSYILPALKSVEGVQRIEVLGNNETTLSIQLDANLLNAKGINPSEVTTSIKNNLVSGPAGTLTVGGNTEMVTVTSKTESLTHLENLLIGQKRVRLAELGVVKYTQQSKYIARLNEQPSIQINIVKSESANIVELNDKVDTLINEWKTTIPKAQFEVVYSGSKEIKHTISSMLREGALGAIFASLMILAFLRNTRITLIVLVSIPLSILVSLLFLSWFDITLNIMTIGGLTIAIGRVVDDSIVVTENIYSQLQKTYERKESVILQATKQISSAITSSTLTTIAVFIPLSLVSGVVGTLFKPFALTIVSSLLASLLVALTIVPALIKITIIQNKTKPLDHKEKKQRFMTTYNRIIVGALNHRFKTLIITAVIFLVTIVVITPKLPVQALPQGESSNKLAFHLSLPREISKSTMNSKIKEVEQLLVHAKDQDDKLFSSVLAVVGSDGGSEIEYSYKSIILADTKNSSDKQEVMDQYKAKILALLPIGSTVESNVYHDGIGGSANSLFSYTVLGNDDAKLKEAANLIRNKLSEYAELKNITDTLSEAKKQVQITVDQTKAAQYGMNTALIMDSVQSWIMTQNLGELFLDGQLYPTTLEVTPWMNNSVNSMKEITFYLPDSSSVKLNELAQIDEIDAPFDIKRENQNLAISIFAEINGEDVGGISNKIASSLDEIPLPAGIERETAGAAAQINQGFQEMFVAICASVFIVYLIMVIAFRNARAPFSILFSLPFALIGGILGLYITGDALSITALIGFLMLIGIVVTNAIVLIDRVQQLREEGKSIRDALTEASSTRLRPIIMTAGATIMALLPLTFSSTGGSVISKGLAVVVIGGLICSTLLTLIIVPIIYELLYHSESKKHKTVLPPLETVSQEGSS